jgi:hypothetical protein
MDLRRWGQASVLRGVTVACPRPQGSLRPFGYYVWESQGSLYIRHRCLYVNVCSLLMALATALLAFGLAAPRAWIGPAPLYVPICRAPPRPWPNTPRACHIRSLVMAATITLWHLTPSRTLVIIRDDGRAELDLRPEAFWQAPLRPLTVAVVFAFVMPFRLILLSTLPNQAGHVWSSIKRNFWGERREQNSAEMVVKATEGQDNEVQCLILNTTQGRWALLARASACGDGQRVLRGEGGRAEAVAAIQAFLQRGRCRHAPLSHRESTHV